MAIKPVESMPGAPEDVFKVARKQVLDDILQIIRERIPLCEITIKHYSENYYRSIIKEAIRKACDRYNDTRTVQEPTDVYPDMFDVSRRKGYDGKYHWYIKFEIQPEEVE